MTERSLSLLAALLFLGAAPASAVTDLPAAPDSLGTHLSVQDNPYGSATTWMIGMTLVEQGDLAGALPYLAQAWRMSPGEVELSEVYRDVLLELGYARDALEVSHSVLEAMPDDPRTIEQHVIIQATLEDFDGALAGLDRLNVGHPDSTRLDRLEGEILLRARRWPAARDHFRELLAEDPDDYERLTATLTEVLVLLDQKDEAAEVWSQAIAAHPENRVLRMGRIQFEVGRGDDRAAFEAAADADADGLGVDAHDDMDWIALTAGLIAGAGRIDSVRDLLLERSVEGTLGLEATLYLARILDSTGGNGRAVGLLRDAVERWPDAPRPRVYLGEFLSMGGDLPAAEAAVRDALALDPDHLEGRFSLISILSRRFPAAYDDERDDLADAARTELLDIAQGIVDGVPDLNGPSRLMLGATLHGLGRFEQAVPQFEAAAQDPDFLMDALLNLSVLYDDMDQPDNVREVLERLYNAQPDDPVVQNALGYTLADQGLELERAESLIRTALEQDVENPAYLDSLGWVLYRQGRDIDAFDLLVRAANALPEDPVILEHLARVLNRLGQVSRAEGVAQRALAAGGDPESLADLLPSGDGP